MFDKFNQSHPILKKKDDQVEELVNKETLFAEKGKTQHSVIIFSISDYSYTETTSYKYKEITGIINSFPKDKTVFIQINGDEGLKDHLIRSITRKSIEREDKISKDINKLDLDYTLVLDSSTLCLNLSILSELTYHDIEKYVIQLYIFEKGVILFNPSCNKEIFDTIMNEYKFKEEPNKIFTEKLTRIATTTQKKFTQTDLKARDIIKIPDKLIKNVTMKHSKFNPHAELPLSATSSNFLNLRNKKFTVDGLLYYLINITMDKLKTFSQDIFQDAKTLKEIYLEISENERKDFYRRLECTEIYIILIRNETFSKRNFIEFVKNHYFSTGGEHSRYFGDSSIFLLELLVAKSKQIELNFNQIKFYTNMVKENYNIILEDNSKKNKDRLNQIIKIISLMSVFFMPFNIISGLFGMNIKIPFIEWENLVPFFILLALKIAIFFIHLYIFKKYSFI